MGGQGSEMESFLSDNCPPMGIYETLYAFKDSFGRFMGDKGTHPWSQGFPLTTPLEEFGGPSLPDSIDVSWEDRFYPKAWGHPELRDAISEYYNSQYGSDIVPENVMMTFQNLRHVQKSDAKPYMVLSGANEK